MRLSLLPFEYPLGLPLEIQFYEGPLQGNTSSLAWALGYKLSRERTDDYLFIHADARQGLVVWLQAGDPSEPALILLHGGLGTPVAAQL